MMQSTELFYFELYENIIIYVGILFSLYFIYFVQNSNNTFIVSNKHNFHKIVI